MGEYTVTGRFQARGGWQSFETTIEAPNEDVAVEHTYAEFGSHHGLRRRQIDVEGVQTEGAS